MTRRTPDAMPHLPPQNLEAEQAVLGAVLLNNQALSRASEILSVQDFYRTAHRTIYRAMIELAERSEEIDSITLSERLRTTGEFEAVGGSAYLAELVRDVSSAANVGYHSRIVREKAIARELAQMAHEVLTRLYASQGELPALLEQTEQRVFSLAHGSQASTFLPIQPLLAETLAYIDRVSKHATHLTGIASGFLDLDALTAGWQASDLIVIAGRPSMGKTSLALSAATHAALHEGKTVGIVSLEMSREQLVLRMIGAEGGVDTNALRTGRLRKEDWWRLAEGMARLEGMKLFIDDGGALTVAQLRGKARRLKAEHGLDLLIVDYLQLMQGRSDADSRQEEIADISRALKLLAKELAIPVIALSQLSRAVEARKPPIPMLADLRESGAIEQDSDVVIFIYRDDVYFPDSVKRGIADILVRKHRNGPIGELELVFLDRFAKFENKELRQAEPGLYTRGEPDEVTS